MSAPVLPFPDRDHRLAVQRAEDDVIDLEAALADYDAQYADVFAYRREMALRLTEALRQLEQLRGRVS